jgi:cytochrome P450
MIVLGPPAWPLVGNLPAFCAGKLDFLMRCAREYGGVVRLNLGGTTYLVNNPDDIRHILETNNDNYSKTLRLTSKRGRWLSGHGLLTSSGAAHVAQRRMMQPVFHQHVLSALAELIVSETERMTSTWKDGAEFNIFAEMMALTQRIIGMALFGVDLLAEARELGQAIRARRRYIEYWFDSLFPFPEYLPNRINREYRRAKKIIDAAIHQMIRGRRESKSARRDLLTMLMEASYADGSKMSDVQVRDEAITLSITGFETIGVALAWTWYLLAQHPEAEANLLAELKRECNGRTANASDLPKLRYTRMVFLESMRLYPPTWLYIRIALREDTLPSGAKIPRGAKLYLCQYVMHRDRRYFSNPDQFDPLRFADQAIKNRPKYAYFPFGGGPHLCIGQGLAMMEGVLVLATIAPRWRLSFTPGQLITPVPAIILRPKDGILMRCNRRFL